MMNFMCVIYIMFVSIYCVHLYPHKNGTLCAGDCSNIRLHNDSYSSASINTNTSSIIKNAFDINTILGVKGNKAIACSENQRKDPSGQCRDIEF